MSLPWASIDLRMVSRRAPSSRSEPLLELAELTVVQAARGFLAIARDERHRRALVQECYRSPDLVGPGADILGDDAGDLVERCGHGELCPACCGRKT